MGDKVVWKGDTGTARAMVFGPTRHLIACLANCEGLRYWAANSLSKQSHFGMLYAFPVTLLDDSRSGPAFLPLNDFQWVFKKTVRERQTLGSL